METEVVDFFATMFRANPKDYWGYVTNGGSESNLYGLYLARELYPNAMVYFSESTHYSIKKNIRLLNIPSIVIRSQENGEIDYDDLANTLQFNRDKPAIVLTNFGTLPTIANNVANNFILLIIDNGSYGSTGDQPTYAGKKTSLSAVAAACGCENVVECQAEDAAVTMQAALDSNEMTIIVCKCMSGNIKVPVITMDPVVIRERFMKEVEARNT